jgi:hypothetical protein
MAAGRAAAAWRRCGSASADGTGREDHVPGAQVLEPDGVAQRDALNSDVAVVDGAADRQSMERAVRSVLALRQTSRSRV